MSNTVKDLEFLIKQNLNNLADIPDNEDLIIKYLVRRYEQGRVYTWVGPVLLAINPGHSISNLYDQPHQDNFTILSNASQSHEIIEPHVFAVAAAARYRLVHGLGKVHQVIVISGDSGSGKTFSASKILRFLAATDGSLSSLDKNPSFTLSKIERACLVISAFSTASTERNECSSRHGQLVQLQYLNSSMQGAVLNSFLIEQSRVTSGCNNFHIFGQMLAGLSESELETLRLSRTTFYKIANNGHNYTQEAYITAFGGTIEAMNSLGLGDELREEILKVIGLLIHLGNIRFREQVTVGCDVDVHRKDSADALEGACSLMVLPSSDLVKLLTTNLIRPRSRSQRHSMYYSAITTTEGCNARLHSIIRYLYYRLFQWLVNRLNETLTCKEESPKMLGILDIFGFEFFCENSIEQLSINYANERMQNHFMQNYLEAGRSELESEGLSTSPPPPTSGIYKQRLAAIESGLFPVLNDACLVARIDKLTSLNRFVLSAREGNERFIQNRGETFAVCHYSSVVEYKTVDILRKNTDKVPAELLLTITLCQNKFLLSLLDNDEDREEVHQQDRPRIAKNKNTTLAKLKHRMDALIKELDKYDLHYIRCIRPVDRVNDPGMIKEFKEQLACSGILDALPLARCTLPIRLRYDEFSERYSKRTTVDDEVLVSIKDSVEIGVYPTEIADPICICKTILKRLFNEEELLSLVHFGSQLIFMSETVLYRLEILRDEFRSQCASKIQRVWHKYKLRKQPKLLEASTQNIDLDIKVLSDDTKKKLSLRNLEDNRDCNTLKNLMSDLNNRVFFYRNRILSRRRLADVPLRFHTRLTCLLDSHRLPRCELPNGLKDCL